MPPLKKIHFMCCLILILDQPIFTSFLFPTPTRSLLFTLSCFFLYLSVSPSLSFLPFLAPLYRLVAPILFPGYISLPPLCLLDYLVFWIFLFSFMVQCFFGFHFFMLSFVSFVTNLAIHILLLISPSSHLPLICSSLRVSLLMHALITFSSHLAPLYCLFIVIYLAFPLNHRSLSLSPSL